MGAIASGGVRVLNELVVQAVPNGAAALARIAEKEAVELHRREVLYRQGRPAPTLAEKTVILVDDGLATGATMRAAVQSLRAHRAARIVVAAPVGSADSHASLAREADEVVCLATPDPFFSVGEFYDDFGQTSDTEVEQLLADAARRPLPNQSL
jgi:putative phosphoribosyl transferase